MSAFTEKDFKDHYVLGGRCHNPNNNGTIFEQFVVGTFTSIFPEEIIDDENAVKRADSRVSQLLSEAKIGEELAATLWFNNRIVKNYAKVTKE